MAKENDLPTTRQRSYKYKKTFTGAVKVLLTTSVANKAGVKPVMTTLL